jgi:hypothetical protein
MSKHVLSKRVAQEAMARLQSLLLLSAVVSQAVSRQVSSSQTLIQSLLLGGRERLGALLFAASRIKVPSRGQSDGEYAPSDESTIQALLERCLDLLLQWMTRHERESGAYSAPLRRSLSALRVDSPTPSPNFPGLRLCFFPSLT